MKVLLTPRQIRNSMVDSLDFLGRILRLRRLANAVVGTRVARLSRLDLRYVGDGPLLWIFANFVDGKQVPPLLRIWNFELIQVARRLFAMYASRHDFRFLGPSLHVVLVALDRKTEFTDGRQTTRRGLRVLAPEHGRFANGGAAFVRFVSHVFVGDQHCLAFSRV